MFIFLLFHFVSGIFVPNSTRYLDIILHVLNKLFLESLQKTRRPTVIFRQIVFEEVSNYNDISENLGETHPRSLTIAGLMLSFENERSRGVRTRPRSIHIFL